MISSFLNVSNGILLTITDRTEINRRNTDIAQFDIDNHLSNGKRLGWLVLLDQGERAESVVQQFKQAAINKFSGIVYFNEWEHVVASNGYVTVRMNA